MELAQAACPGRPRAKPDDLLPQIDHKAVAREFTAAADTQFGGAASAFREAHLVAIILDAVTIWGRQLLPVSMANALLRGVKPLLVQVCGDFAGTIRAYAAALRPTVVIVRNCGGEIAGFVCDGLSAQANTVDPNCASCFFKDMRELAGALFAWCGCHLSQLAFGDAMDACPSFAAAGHAIDKGAEILRSKPIALEIELVVPAPVATRWAAKMGTINFLQRHPDIANRVCGAVMQGRIGATTVLDRGEGDGGRPVRKLLTARRLEALRDLLTGQDIVYLVLAGPYLEASRVMEGNDTSCGDILWLLERAYETSFSWRDDFAALGFVVGEGDIETVRASFIQRFYRGRCADVYLLG